MNTPKVAAAVEVAGFAILVGLAGAFLGVADRGILESALIIGCLAVSVQVVYGMLGELSLGQGALFGTGAYTYGLVSEHADVIVSTMSALIVTLLMAVLLGHLLAKVEGAYFAVVTFAVTILLGTLVANVTVLGGPNGLIGVAGLSGATTANVLPLVYAAASMLLAVMILYVVWRSAIGLGLEVSKADRKLAGSLGLNSRAMVVTAMAVSAIPAGLAGVVFAGSGRYVGPTVFSFYYIVIPLSIIALGGVRSLWACISGSLIEIAIPLALNLNALTVEIASGLILAGVVIFLPSGINGAIGDVVLRSLRSRVAVVGGELGTTGVTEYKKYNKEERSEGPPHHSEVRTKSSDSPARELSAVHVIVQYGGLRAVDDVTLSVEAGEIVGLIGPNGAGKSSLVGALVGSVPLAGGEVMVGGESLGAKPDYVRARQGLGRTFQDVALVPVLSVRQSLIVAQCRGRVFRHGLRLPALKASSLEAARACGLMGRLERKVADLTNLERRALQVALALSTAPKFLLLDEATAGLSEQDRDTFMAVVRHAAREAGLGVLAIEHDVRFVSQLCDRIAAMSDGALVANDRPEVVLSDQRVVTSYLGKGWQRSLNSIESRSITAE